MEGFLKNLASGAANKAIVGAAIGLAAPLAAPGLGEIVDAVSVLFGLPPEMAKAITVLASAALGLIGVYATPNRQG